MKFKTKYNSQYRWHKWFAWFPIPFIETDFKKEWVWLETIERKCVTVPYDWFWKYRLIKKEKKK